MKNEIDKILVTAGVRYWSDCEYSTDSGGTWIQEKDDRPETWEKFKRIIPMVRNKNIGYGEKDYWCIEIDYESGKIKDWPENFRLKTYFKVCDDGRYQIVAKNGDVLWDSFKSKCFYVPRFFDMDDDGYGDYLDLNIYGNGVISHWDIAKRRIRNLVS